MILSLDSRGQGMIKSKVYNRTHLSEMFDLYDDVSKIRREDSQHMIMVGNGKLIKHTGDLQSKEIQALFGQAIRKKALKIDFNQDMLA